MTDLFAGFQALPSYGLTALVVLLLYGVQAEVRFGAKARSHSTGASDRGSTVAVSVASSISVIGFVLAMKETAFSWIPDWFTKAMLPGMPVIAWAGVILGAIGLAVRLWAVLTLRERYTRTLLTHEQHAVERRGPYRWIRHPGYLGSLLCLNGVAMASGNFAALFASLAATVAAYEYRIRVEDEMLVKALEGYDSYRRSVAALVPFLR